MSAARSSTLRDALRRAVGGAWILLLLLGASLRAVGADEAGEPPVAQPPSEEKEETGEEDLFAALLAGKADGEWRGVLNRIRKEKDAPWIGQQLGALFRDRLRFEDRTDLAAFTAAYLADHPDGDRVLLGHEILRRAFRDEAFLQGLRRHITVGEGGWARLLDHARELLASDAARDRAVAVWFLSREEGGQRERVRQDLIAGARQDVPVIEAGGDAGRMLSKAYLESFETLLRFPFRSVAQAVATLDELQALDLAALVRELSSRKDAPTAPLAVKVAEYGKRLIDGIVKDGKPEALKEFLDPARTSLVALRRYAMLKAAGLTTAADATWADLLRLVFEKEDDPEVLARALDLLEQIGFAEQPDHALALSTALTARLAARGPGGAGGRDRTEDRVRMARAVGTLRMRTPELMGLLAAIDGLETTVAAELVRALGRIDGVTVEEILAIYEDNAGTDDRQREIRLAAVDALGRPGMRSEGDGAAVAAAALRDILGRAEDSRVRLRALRSLGNHPGEATAKLLQDFALDAEENEAKVAIVVLRKAAVSDANAVGALAKVAATETAPNARRVEALQALAGLGAATQSEAVARARGTARRILESSADPEVRQEAARTAAVLADPTALEAVASYWVEDVSQSDRFDILRDLLDGVAAGGDQHDAAIAQTMLGLEERAPWTGLDELSRALLERHPRNPFRHARARLLVGRARAEGASPEESRAALADADVLLQSILGPEPTDEAFGALGLRVEVQRRLGELAKDDPARKTHWLEAVRLAARSTNPEVAAAGRDVADRLNEAPMAELLTAEERRRLDEDRRALEKVLRGP